MSMQLAMPAPQQIAASFAVDAADLADPDLPPLLIFRADSAPWPARPRERAVHQWADVARLTEEPAGFYLGRGLKASDADALLDRIRRSPWWYLPVLSAPGRTAPLADAAADLVDALDICDRARAAREELGLSPNGLPLIERLLYFLQVREGSQLWPERDRRHKLLYRYPLAEALASPHDDVGSCLATMLRGRLLEPAKLVDRTRHCCRCNSAHIHFVEVCPTCGGLDIRTTAALPCFACGYVAPESDFLRRDGLVCPRCDAAEPNIGVDEEEPILQQVCGHCQKAFATSVTQAHCLDCDHVCSPDELEIREIASLRLTAAGQAYLRTGSRQQPLAVFDTLNSVQPQEFIRTVDWALAAQSRRAEVGFGLLLVSLHDTGLLQDGSPLATRLTLSLAEFARQLRGLIRASDNTTRINGDRLWFYLPFSDALGARRRIDGVLALAEFRELVKELRIDVRGMQLPERRNSGEDAAALMKRLGG
ncbi:hypothetical protein GT347_10490 [Xylophilus rhododendri]|uniref:Thaumarchaeal output domain-containing protein n=1 Tax=Xylophilus rhododendri TaxID=2697032 RepID=A0A857J599_9BURK|nr:hypothetical protein [Xylophilus rhododendri]QHI98383.1 hypothetical protein GT347_10490 [Xylophilus rhododendri]